MHACMTCQSVLAFTEKRQPSMADLNALAEGTAIDTVIIAWKSWLSQQYVAAQRYACSPNGEWSWQTS